MTPLDHGMLDHACVIADTPAAEVQVRRYMGRVLALVGWTVSLSHLDVAAEILEEVSGRDMPLGIYLPLHPEAAVSPADIEVLRGFFATNPAD